MRVMLVQYAGDYRAAYRLGQQSGAETYYGHRYVLAQLEAIQAQLGPAAILCCRSPEAYQLTLPRGLPPWPSRRRCSPSAAIAPVPSVMKDEP